MNLAKGFTLVETLLTLAVVAIIAGIAFPVYFQLKPKSDLDLATLTVVENLRRAQSLAMSGERDYAWGVALEPGAVSLFAINAAGQHEAAYDEVTVLPDTIAITGITSTIFKKITGEPTTTGSVTLSNAAYALFETITINQRGLVDF